MRESAAGRVGTGMLLGMLGFAVVWLAELPFGLAAVWWQRDHGVSHQGYLEWILESFLGLGGTFVFVAAALAIAMGLAGPLRRWWWVAAAPIFVGLALLFTFVSPYLVPDTSPLHEPQLAEARALERRRGSRGRGSWSRTSTASPRLPTPRRPASARPGPWSSGTRCWATTSAAPRCAPCWATRSPTSRITTRSSWSAGWRSS